MADRFLLDRAGFVVARHSRRLLWWLHAKRWAAFGVMVLLYALAFPPLVLLYQSKGSPLLSALGAGLVGFIFGAALMLVAGVSLGRATVFGLVIGLLLGELSWAISYWSIVGLVGGALLWLFFYVLAGLSQAYVEGALDRRVAVEYAIVAALGLVVLLSAAPWRG